MGAPQLFCEAGLVKFWMSKYRNLLSAEVIADVTIDAMNASSSGHRSHYYRQGPSSYLDSPSTLYTLNRDHLSLFKGYKENPGTWVTGAYSS